MATQAEKDAAAEVERVRREAAGEAAETPVERAAREKLADENARRGDGPGYVR